METISNVICEKGEGILKHFESLRLRAYRCPAGKPTIGWGHTRTVSEADIGRKVITEEQAEELLNSDLVYFRDGVLALCSRVPNENQLGAMVVLAFNIGLANFAKSSVLRLHNAGKYTEAAQAFKLWVKARIDGQLVTMPGLVARRGAESMLYLEPVISRAPTPDVAHVPQAEQTHLMPQEVEPEKPLASSTIIQASSVAAISSGLAGAVEVAKQVQELRTTLGDLLLPAALLLATAAAGYAIWQRLQQRKQGIA